MPSPSARRTPTSRPSTGAAASFGASVGVAGELHDCALRRSSEPARPTRACRRTPGVASPSVDHALGTSVCRASTQRQKIASSAPRQIANVAQQAIEHRRDRASLPCSRTLPGRRGGAPSICAGVSLWSPMARRAHRSCHRGRRRALRLTASHATIIAAAPIHAESARRRSTRIACRATQAVCDAPDARSSRVRDARSGDRRAESIVDVHDRHARRATVQHREQRRDAAETTRHIRHSSAPRSPARAPGRRPPMAARRPSPRSRSRPRRTRARRARASTR